jgi:hypothetical protein
MPRGSASRRAPARRTKGVSPGDAASAGPASRPASRPPIAPGPWSATAAPVSRDRAASATRAACPGASATPGRCVDRCDVAGCPGALRCDAASGLCEEDAPCRDDAGLSARSGLCGRRLHRRLCRGGAVSRRDGLCRRALRGARLLSRSPRLLHPGRVCTAEGLCRPGCDAARPCGGHAALRGRPLCRGRGLRGRPGLPRGPRLQSCDCDLCAASCAGGAPCPPGDALQPGRLLPGALLRGRRGLRPRGGLPARHLSGPRVSPLRRMRAAAGLRRRRVRSPKRPARATAPPAGTATRPSARSRGDARPAPVRPDGSLLAEGTCGLCAPTGTAAGRTCIAGFCAEPALRARRRLPPRASAARPPGAACVDDDLAPNHAPDFAVALDAAVHTEPHGLRRPRGLVHRRAMIRRPAGRRPGSPPTAARWPCRSIPLGGAFGPARGRERRRAG